jgi:predicted MFS family arabinose efflux permease
VRCAASSRRRDRGGQLPAGRGARRGGARVRGDRRRAAGSAVGGLVYDARSWPGSAPRRLAVLLLALGAAFALLAVAETEVALAALLVLSGLLLAPTTVIGSTLLDTVAPTGTVTEAFTVMVMAIVVGTAVGNAVGGSLVESASYERAVLLAGVVAAAGAALTLARRRSLVAA